MAKTLEALVAAAAKKADTAGLATLLGQYVQRAVARRAPQPRRVPPPVAPAPFGSTTSGIERARRAVPTRRPRGLGPKVLPLITSARHSGIRPGTDRYAKLEYVLARCAGGDVYLNQLISREYVAGSGKKLGMGCIKGMVDRAHIKLED